MNVFSRLPLSLLFYKHWAPDDREVGVVLAKAVFKRHGDGKMRAGPAPGVSLEDVFDGDPAWAPLIAEQDIAPCKRGTDLTLAATARSAEGKPRGDWAVEVTVPGRLHYQFQVRGPAAWTPRRRRWERSAPELVNEVPLTYALAFGGAAPGPDGDTVYAYNPAGIGLVTPERLAARDEIPAPQIGLLGELMAEDPLATISVQGTGPIAKSWLPRRAFAGTLDADWLADRHPRMPADFDPQFWNAAPGALQLKDGLRGDEVIAVAGVTEAPGPVETPLPGVWCGLRMSGTAPTEQMLGLDTVHLDISDPDPEEHSVTLIWRTQIDQPERFREAEVISGRLEQ